MENICGVFNIPKEIIDIANESEEEVLSMYQKVDQIAMYNQAKVLKAFQDNNISTVHLGKTTGYGYDDAGRDAIEKLYAQIFKTEDSLVRVQFVNGTHAIATVLKALLMPGDNMLAISGKPYDTLCEVIGIEENPLSLKNYGVSYSQIDLTEGGYFDYDKIKEYLSKNKVKLVHIQRSKGYSLRKSFTIEDLKNVIDVIKSIDKEVYVMVDNCYGEFVEEKEPTEVGADIVCGSLIKNIGGGLCETGAYICGKKDLIDLCSQVLTCPGIGKECGATLDQNKNILQGLFMAPCIVKNAVKSAIFAASFLNKLGFEVYPDAFEDRSDIIQAIKFGDKEKLIKFIQGIQKSSPIDSHVLPLPWDMPGYTDQVIMAAGTFVQGASIELSADSPIREPYVAYMQGGITFESAKIAIITAASKMLGEV